MLLKKLIWLFWFCCPLFFADKSYADTISSFKEHLVVPLSDYYAYQLSEANLSAAVFATRSFVRCELQNSYLMKEMTTAKAASALIYRQNLFSLRFSHFGFSLFGEMNLLIGYARAFGNRVSIATQFHYLWQHAQGQEGVHSLTFDVSLFMKLSSKMGCGFVVYNPARLKYGMVSEIPLPIHLRFDFQYDIGRNILLFAAIDKELRRDWYVQLGALYKIKVLFIGMQVQFPRIVCGISGCIAWQRFLLGADFQYTHPLGLVPRLKCQIIW
jgi:hypothetical protein